MTFIIIICILGAIALITCLIFVSIDRLNMQKRANNILQFGKKRDYYVYELLNSGLPHGSVFRKKYFPVVMPEGVFDTEVDIVCILNSGIAVIDVRGTKGNITVSKSGEWVSDYNGTLKKHRNPYEINEVNISAVKIALEREGIYNVPIYNYVIFASAEASFSRKFPWMLTPDTALERLKALDNKLVLTRKDKQNLSAFFVRHSKQKHPPIRQKKIKNQHKKKRVRRNEHQNQKVRR